MKNDRELLKEANELIRSFSCVIERKGLDTNWDGLEKQTKRVLSDQYELKLFSLPSVTNHVKNAERCCGNCDNCDLDDTRINPKHFCKITEEDITDIDQHYCDAHYKGID